MRDSFSLLVVTQEFPLLPPPPVLVGSPPSEADRKPNLDPGLPLVPGLSQSGC
ncbi:hypothetical protein AAFM79_17930 [Trichormus azollae HNT15244]